MVNLSLRASGEVKVLDHSKAQPWTTSLTQFTPSVIPLLLCFKGFLRTAPFLTHPERLLKSPHWYLFLDASCLPFSKLNFPSLMEFACVWHSDFSYIHLHHFCYETPIVISCYIPFVSQPSHGRHLWGTSRTYAVSTFCLIPSLLLAWRDHCYYPTFLPQLFLDIPAFRLPQCSVISTHWPNNSDKQIRSCCCTVESSPKATKYRKKMKAFETSDRATLNLAISPTWNLC